MIKFSIREGRMLMSMEKLRAAYYGIYGENGITDFFYDQLVNIIATAKKKEVLL